MLDRRGGKLPAETVLGMVTIQNTDRPATRATSASTNSFFSIANPTRKGVQNTRCA